MYSYILYPLLISLLITPVIRFIALNLGIVDSPDHKRKFHNGHTPLLGGLSIFIALYFSIWYLGIASDKIIGFLIGGTIIFVVGLLDDIFDLSPLAKIIGQISSAVIIIIYGINISVAWLPNFPYDWIFFRLATIIWIVIICNAVNLIDGLDGLASSIAAIAGISIYVVLSRDTTGAVIAVMLASASLGFLPHNLSKKKIFLGDAGSLLIGYFLAVLSILTVTKKTAIFTVLIPFLLLALPLADTVSAILRRLKNGQPIMSADYSHIHHRLIRNGLSHKTALITLCSISIFFSIWALLIDRLPGLWWTPLVVVLPIIVEKEYFASYLFGRKVKRRGYHG